MLVFSSWTLPIDTSNLFLWFHLSPPSSLHLKVMMCHCPPSQALAEQPGGVTVLPTTWEPQPNHLWHGPSTIITSIHINCVSLRLFMSCPQNGREGKGGTTFGKIKEKKKNSKGKRRGGYCWECLFPNERNVLWNRVTQSRSCFLLVGSFGI